MKNNDVIAYLCVSDAKAAIEFCERAFRSKREILTYGVKLRNWP